MENSRGREDIVMGVQRDATELGNTVKPSYVQSTVVNIWNCISNGSNYPNP